MILTLKTEGGIAYFPGLQKIISLDTASLSDADNNRLNELLRVSDFLALPAVHGKQNPHMADGITHILSVKKDHQNKVVKIIEPVEEQSLLDLIGFVREKGKP